MEQFKKYIPVWALIGILGYAVLYFSGHKVGGGYVVLAALVIGTLPLLWQMLKEIARGRAGVDIIAMVAIVTAVFLQQYLAGIVILLMLSGGSALESYAQRRAKKELTALLAHAPSVAHIKRGQEISDVPVEEIKVDDIVVVKPGEIIPVDGIVISGRSLVNEAVITGESRPVEVSESSQVLSGTLNEDGAIEVRVMKESKNSKYEQLIRLVKQAEKDKAPIVRLADRYTLFFTVVTFVLASLAWFISKDPVRILAVLVVATPCPLILATPIAVISGMSRAAKRGIIVKSGGALEKLAQAKSFIFDKTGTITLGTPELADVKGYGAEPQEVLRLAASLDQLSNHILARALVAASRGKSIHLAYPTDYREVFGDGVSGKFDEGGPRYFFGKLKFLEQQGLAISQEIAKEHERIKDQGLIVVYLSDQKQILGAIFFADRIRQESKELFSRLHQEGLQKIIMITGDRKEVAENIARQVGVQEVRAEYLPEQKLSAIKELQTAGLGPVAMVGDGVNDAPALAASDVGIAMGAHGSSASSEAGDIVIAVDNLARVEEIYRIAKRTVRVAKQGIFAGMGVSIILMIIAALGHIVPIGGAIIQEALDVLVIFNALRVHTNGTSRKIPESGG